jgi:hypothetical protein
LVNAVAFSKRWKGCAEHLDLLQNSAADFLACPGVGTADFPNDMNKQLMAFVFCSKA